jgi:hypothetical protein
MAPRPNMEPDFKNSLLVKKPIFQSYEMEICKLNFSEINRGESGEWRVESGGLRVENVKLKVRSEE